MDESSVAEFLMQSIKKYDDSITAIKQCLVAYEEICTEQISIIATSNSLEESEKSFDILYNIQAQLSGLLFNRNIDLGPRLNILTKEFDRLYDPYIREYWFNFFKTGAQWPT